MPRYAVRPDELGDAADLTAGDQAALDVVRRLVAGAVLEARAALGAGAPTLSAAVDGYGHLEGAVAAALDKAAGVLSGGLAVAAHGYPRVDADARATFRGGASGGGP